MNVPLNISKKKYTEKEEKIHNKIYTICFLYCHQTDVHDVSNK